MFDEDYTDSERIDEMLTAEDYNRFEEEQVARDMDILRRDLEEEQEAERRGEEADHDHGSHTCCWCGGRVYNEDGPCGCEIVARSGRAMLEDEERGRM